ncbi:hypothetical protein LZ30DRAFT_684977 [Colletotrichum cereale]|nr:hypothetical protein LZ30DRAFT_684977 [Colletotrichum cereale]
MQSNVAKDCSFQWLNVTPGRWERSMDVREEALLEWTSRPCTEEAGCPYFALVYSKLNHSFSDQEMLRRLREAWRSMRLNHPSIASYPDAATPRMVYEVVTDDEDIDEWTNRTFSCLSDDVSAGELWPRVDTTSHMVFLRYLPNSREIMLGIHHILIDGGGVVMLLNNILEAAVASNRDKMILPSPADQVARLSLPLQAVAGSASLSPDIWDEARSIVNEWVSKRKAIPGTIGVAPTGDLNQPLGRRCEQMSLLLSSDETRRLLAAAKAARLTMSVATHAAVMIASKHHGGDDLNHGRNWVSSLVFGYRHLARPPYDSDRYPIGIMSTGFPQVIENPVDFADAAAKLKVAYKFWQFHPKAVDLMLPIKSLTEQALKQETAVAPKCAVANTSGLGILSGLKEQYGEAGEVELLSFAGGMREHGEKTISHRVFN